MKVENLTKIYRPKGAPPVEALKSVSFTLPDRGMVFLLGQSGSGKSTLLHVLSGLEDFDGGDVYYLGNKFSGFSESDRNRYRNGCCGIIFQEYNLIGELSVGENIALALRIRGERDIDTRVKEVLSRVGLSGYERRRVNQLSGGQKQRVAIARALIKDSRIIFADEPTGALDEYTGRDILMLLKRLSKDRLVLVVSHDRAFAESFGDRIIELADGKIVSDTAPLEQSERNVSLTDPAAGLPFGTALRLGCKNFIRHPVRLLFTVLLSVFSLIFAGIPATVAVFDEADAYVNAIENAGVQVTSLQRYERYPYDNLDDPFGGLFGEYYKEKRMPVTSDDAARLQDILGYPVAKAYNPASFVFSFQDNVADMDIVVEEASKAGQTERLMYCPYGYVEMDDALLSHLGYVLYGRLPSAPDEIAIPMSAYRCFAVGSILQGQTVVAVNEPGDVIGRAIELEELIYGDATTTVSHPMTITGIIDTGCDVECYHTHSEENIHDSFYVVEGYLEQYNFLYFSMPESRAAMKELVSYVIGSDDGTQFMRLFNSTTTVNFDFETNVRFYSIMSKLSLYLCAVFFVFSFMLLLNFISASVRGKLRQMGILCALGTGFSGTVKIYTGSAVILGAFTFAICAALMPFALMLFNGFAGHYVYSSSFALTLGALPYLIMLGISVLSAVCGSLAVVLKYAHKSPAEIIRIGQT